jgi:hypothetical protein
MSTIGPDGEIENEFLCDGTSKKLDKGARYRLKHPNAWRTWYQANKEHRQVYLIETYSRRRETSLLWKEAHPDRVRVHARKHLYGLNNETYELLLLQQQGRCAICRKTPEEAKQKVKVVLCVDHNHRTNIVRGLLCDYCNRQIAWYEKYKDIVTSYLEES